MPHESFPARDGQLIEENLLEAVIGLPANLFFGTGIEEEAEIDLKAVKKEIAGLEKQLVAVRAKMDGYLKELGL